ncbi:MAG: biopolymer transporter ExbD [Gammaproteobacteria bacterium]|nr:biopolymer transporter ExbD [Gammaproteobacteria bacterium]
MKSRKAKRMEKHHKRRSVGGLNLISLMDIFTILVFFLLVNSQDVEVLPNARDLQLPESYAEERARENVVIMVTADQVLVQGRLVAEVKDVMSQDAIVIPALESELRLQTERLLRKDDQARVEDREVTIMGDRELPYSLLKRIMASCTAAQYGKISLAVTQAAPEPGQIMAEVTGR